MSEIMQKINQFFELVGHRNPKIAYIEPIERANYVIEDVIYLIDLLPKVTEIFRKYHGLLQGRSVEIDVVTKADLEITNIVNSFTAKKYPRDLIVSEEEDTDFRQNPEGIVIFDPLDGTKPFSEGKSNCCFAFSRFDIKEHVLKQGYSIVWEPFNNVLTVGIYGVGVFIAGRKLIKNNKIVASVSSFKSEIKKIEYGKRILDKAFNTVEYSFSGSGSIEACRLITNEINVILRDKQKLWDFVPGAFMAYLAGKHVFSHDTKEDIFPLKIGKFIRILGTATTKSDRKINYVTICATENQRNRIFSAYSEIH